MAKRFTDTDKWKKPFIKTLEAPYKLLWLYILDDCDHAGMWQVDIEIASIRIGEKIDIKKAIENFGDKIKVLDNGEKWFVQDFIDFQYGILNPENRAHKSVLNLLEKYINKGLISSLQGAKDKDKDKEKDKEKVKVKDKDAKILLPYDSKKFTELWDKLIKQKKWRSKSKESLEISVQFLAKHPEDDACKIMENTIMGGWQGLFELKDAQKKSVNNRNNTIATKEQLLNEKL